MLLAVTELAPFTDNGAVESGDPDVAPLETAGIGAAEAGLKRQMEFLDRGLVAVRRTSSEVYVGWRLFGTDADEIAFNLYRRTGRGEPVKLNATPLVQTSDFVDATANLSETNVYFVRPIVAGAELAPSESFVLAANAPVRQYLNVPLQIPPGGVTPDGDSYAYSAGDASVGDLDGDGQYEIVLKWDPSNQKDNSQSGYTGNVYIDAYKLDGTRLWRIDLGRNIRAGAHYTQFMVYDLDGDGKAEIAMKTAPGTIDGLGNPVLRRGDSASDDYRNSGGYILTGPEYLTVFSGETGEQLATVPYEPVRGSASQWGDNYGNRVDRFTAGIAYLDGQRPSLIMARGYYGPQSSSGQARNEIAAYNFRDGQLTLQWHFRAGWNINGNINRNYVSQGAHSLTIGDVDGDGRDEIIYGAAAIDDDGRGLYTTSLGHGDALHLSDMDPSRPGLEVFMVHESPGSYGDAGGEFRDAATGELIFGIPATNDVGRGVAFDIDPNYPGYEMWATTSDADGGPRMIYSSQGQPIYATPGNMMYNFGVWWDADPLRELLDGTTISDWNYVTRGRQNLVFAPPGAAANNGTKNTPALSADILGDWREEVIWRRADNTALQIWTTTIPSTMRLYTLMHDTQYREAIAWQNVGYNQPPHPSFFLGAGMADPPKPSIYLVKAAGEIEGDFNGDGLVDADDLSVWRQTFGMSLPHGKLPGDADGDGDADGADFLAWQRNFVSSELAASALAEVRVAPTISLVEDDARNASVAMLDAAFATLDGTPNCAPSASARSWASWHIALNRKVERAFSEFVLERVAVSYIEVAQQSTAFPDEDTCETRERRQRQAPRAVECITLDAGIRRH